MEIGTSNADAVQENDYVVIELTDTDAEEHIVVGKVDGRNGPFLTTTIPYSHNSTRFDLIGIDAEDRGPYPEADKWISRFEKRPYNLYMEAQVRPSGDIQIDGV